MSLDMTTGAAPAGIPSEPASAAAQSNAATANAQTGGADGGDESQVTPKTYTEQEHRDAIERATAKAAAKAERRAFREAAARLQQQPASQEQAAQSAPPDGRPQRAQFATQESYEDAVADWRLDQREAMKQRQTLAQKTEAIYERAEKLPGFDRDAFDELPLTKPIVEALVESDVPEQLMHYMAANPAEMERIAKLSPARQGAELGKLEAKLAAKAAEPPARSNAPRALEQVRGGGAKSAPNPKDSAAWIRHQNERDAARMRGK